MQSFSFTTYLDGLVKVQMTSNSSGFFCVRYIYSFVYCSFFKSCTTRNEISLLVSVILWPCLLEQVVWATTFGLSTNYTLPSFGDKMMCRSCPHYPILVTVSRFGKTSLVEFRFFSIHHFSTDLGISCPDPLWAKRKEIWWPAVPCDQHARRTCKVRLKMAKHSSLLSVSQNRHGSKDHCPKSNMTQPI